MTTTLFFLLEHNGSIRALDQSTLGILGYSSEELIGKSFAALLDPNGKLLLEKELASLGALPCVQTSLLSKSGRTLPVEMQFTALHRTENAEPLFAGVGTISPESLPENIARKELSRNIAHELNNGLVAVRGFAQMIEKSPGITEEIRDCAKEILEAATRIQSISNQLRVTPSGAAPAPKKAPAPVPKAALVPTKPRALIVEDDEAIAEVLCYYIQDHFSTTLMPKPEDALKEIEKGGYALIISDLNMPRISGMKILAHARQHQPKTPVIIVSGLISDSPEAKQAMDLGAAGFVEKPSFDWNSVKEILEKFGSR